MFGMRSSYSPVQPFYQQLVALSMLVTLSTLATESIVKHQGGLKWACTKSPKVLTVAYYVLSLALQWVTHGNSTHPTLSHRDDIKFCRHSNYEHNQHRRTTVVSVRHMHTGSYTLLMAQITLSASQKRPHSNAINLNDGTLSVHVWAGLCGWDCEAFSVLRGNAWFAAQYPSF